jgi:hypothetical protein
MHGPLNVKFDKRTFSLPSITNYITARNTVILHKETVAYLANEFSEFYEIRWFTAVVIKQRACGSYSEPD